MSGEDPEIVFCSDPKAEQFFPGAKWTPVTASDLQKKIAKAYTQLDRGDYEEVERGEIAVLMYTFAQALQASLS